MPRQCHSTKFQGKCLGSQTWCILSTLRPSIPRVIGQGTLIQTNTLQKRVLHDELGGLGPLGGLGAPRSKVYCRHIWPRNAPNLACSLQCTCEDGSRSRSPHRWLRVGDVSVRDCPQNKSELGKASISSHVLCGSSELCLKLYQSPEPKPQFIDLN